MTAAFPMRAIHMAASLFAGGASPGAAVDLSQFAGRPHAIIIAGPGILAPATVAFQVAAANPADPCVPIAPWTAVAALDICQAGDPPALTVVIDPEAEPYATQGHSICVVPLPCPADFVRATSTDVDNITVLFGGTARNAPVV